jgi:hypothetical protein
VTLTGKKKVAIVGFCDANRDLAPYEDPTWEIWGLNRGSIFMHRADRWFDMHSPEIRHWDQRRPGKHEVFLRTFGGPVYLHEVDPNIPTSLAYPLEEVAADINANLFRVDALGGSLLPTTNQPYLTSSITYEIALAIHEGFEEIAPLWGGLEHERGVRLAKKLGRESARHRAGARHSRDPAGQLSAPAREPVRPRFHEARGRALVEPAI